MAPRNCLFLDRQDEHAIASTPIETSTCSLGLSEPIGEAFFMDREKVFDPSGWLLKASDALKCLFLGRQREKATQTAVLASRNCLFLDRRGQKAIASTPTETSRAFWESFGIAISSTGRGKRQSRALPPRTSRAPFPRQREEKAIVSTPTQVPPMPLQAPQDNA